MKNIVENEFFRGLLIILLGVDLAFVVLSGDIAYLNFMVIWKNIAKPVLAVMIICGLAMFAFIIRSAGHYRDSDEIIPNFFDRIPFEIYIFIDCAIGFTAAGFLAHALLLRYFEISVLLICIIYLSIIFLIISLAVRCKSHTLITNTITYKCFYCVVKAYRNIKKTISFYIANIPTMKKFILAVLVIIIVDIWALNIFSPYDLRIYALFHILRIIAGSTFAFKYITAYFKISDGIRKIAQGDTRYAVDTSDMPKFMAQQAKELNNINTGVANAVSKQMKSEKLKTELITNVSHDIKTPLTSIINYIDLIKKENITQQPVKDYVDVLERQSVRLKN